MHTDVVVVGAGPAGCMAAKKLAEGGAEVLLCEEHRSVGFPVQCTGLLSQRALDECEVSDACIVRPLKRARIYAPSGGCLCIGDERTRAYCVDRRILDGEMARNAVRAGARLLLGAHIRAVRPHYEGVVVEGVYDGKPLSLDARVCIVAEGVGGRITRSLGLGGVKKVLSGVQLEVPYSPPDEEGVDLFLGGWAPGLFGWAVPSHGGQARIGLAMEPGLSQTSPHEHLMRMMREHPALKEHLASPHTSLGFVLGGIPMGTPERTSADGVMVVGDAAGHVKPTTGGGVYMGVRCAKMAAEVALMALDDGDTSAGTLAAYDRAWRGEVGKELSVGLRLQEFFSGLSDGQLDEIVAALAKPEVVHVINEHGDMEKPIELARRIASKLGMSMLPILKALLFR